MSSNYFPLNVIILATHGSYFIPDIVKDKLSKDFLNHNSRLLKNFSDFATQYLISDNIPNDQKIIANFSRAIGDPNRSRDAVDLFLDNDFGGVKIWYNELNNYERDFLLSNYYDNYHNNISKIISKLENNNDKLFIFDIHDTGNLKMSKEFINDTLKTENFPPICIGNVFGKSCEEKIFLEFSYLLEKNLGYKPFLNTPYSGGYVTQKYGSFYNENLPKGEKFKRNVIQIEFGRYLYMDEKSQIIDFDKILKIRNGLEKSIIELSLKFK